MIKARLSLLATKSTRTPVTRKLTATLLGTRRTTRLTRSRSMTRTVITTYLRCLAPRRTITFRWVLGLIPPVHSTPTSNGPKSRMDSTDTNAPLPPLPLQQAMSAQGCTPLTIQISTRGHLSHHHTTLIPLTRDQSRHITTTPRRVEKATEATGVQRAMFRLRDLASDGVRLETSTELAEEVLASHLLGFRSALVVR